MIDDLLRYQLEIDRENRQKAQAKQEKEKRAKIAELRKRVAKENEVRLKLIQYAGGFLPKGVEVRYQPI